MRHLEMLHIFSQSLDQLLIPMRRSLFFLLQQLMDIRHQLLKLLPVLGIYPLYFPEFVV